jgi:hypothetical protein
MKTFNEYLGEDVKQLLEASGYNDGDIFDWLIASAAGGLFSLGTSIKDGIKKHFEDKKEKEKSNIEEIDEAGKRFDDINEKITNGELTGKEARDLMHAETLKLKKKGIDIEKDESLQKSLRTSVERSHRLEQEKQQKEADDVETEIDNIDSDLESLNDDLEYARDGRRKKQIEDKIKKSETKKRELIKKQSKINGNIKSLDDSEKKMSKIHKPEISKKEEPKKDDSKKEVEKPESKEKEKPVKSTSKEKDVDIKELEKHKEQSIDKEGKVKVNDKEKEKEPESKQKKTKKDVAPSETTPEEGEDKYDKVDLGGMSKKQVESAIERKDVTIKKRQQEYAQLKNKDTKTAKELKQQIDRHIQRMRDLANRYYQLR